MMLLSRLRRFLDERLQPSYMTLVSTTVTGLTVALALVLFFTSERGKTLFGIPLGADFAGFYVAAQILNHGQPHDLYNRTLHHQLYHDLLPEESQQVAIPYVHPPFVAGLLKPVARLPYPQAVMIWLVITAMFYLSATYIVIRSLPYDLVHQRWLILMLACSFEPFAFECWLGGQLSAIGYFSFALCFAALQRQQPLWAGIALGICFYKPTLLLTVLPLLVVGGRWKILLGMTVTGLALAGLSFAYVGWDVSLGYVNELLAFNKSTAGGELEIRSWKYVDLNNCLRLILPGQSWIRTPLLLLLLLLPFAVLATVWWKSSQQNDRFRQLLWAATLTWTPVLNLYFGIYDSILIVQSILITAAVVCLRSTNATPLTHSGLAYLFLAISIAPWFSQNLAAVTGVPIYTFLLVVLGIFQLRQLSKPNSAELPSEPSLPLSAVEQNRPS